MSGHDVSTVRLPPSLDAAASRALADELLALRGRPLLLDGAEVERLGGLGLQVLLSARRTWEGDGVSLTLTRPSAPFTEALALFGAGFLAGSAPGAVHDV